MGQVLLDDTLGPWRARTMRSKMLEGTSGITHSTYDAAAPLEALVLAAGLYRFAVQRSWIAIGHKSAAGRCGYGHAWCPRMTAIIGMWQVDI